MISNKKLLFLPGDGIGPEVMKEVRNVIEWMEAEKLVSFQIEEDLVGGAAYDTHRTSLTTETLEKAISSDAVLLGAVGGEKWKDVERDRRLVAAHAAQ